MALRFLRRDKSKGEVEKQEGTFPAIFGSARVSDKDRAVLNELLEKYSLHKEFDTSQDLKALLSITSEVKAINNQAAILHGERIKRAQTILKKYRDGAFTAWLIATYGNRQTPYNFLQYYDFQTKMPSDLKPQIESMPRQAVYTLASRDGALEKKEEIVRNYQGETKQQMITKIRTLFPLDEQDKRRGDVADGALMALKRAVSGFQQPAVKLTKKQSKELLGLIDNLRVLVEKVETE